jgi:uncharacterized protein (TIGR03086 family)
VRALLSHMVGATNRAAHVGEGGYFLDVESRVHGVPDDGWLQAFRQAAARAQAAWADDAKLDGLVAVPWGKVPGRGALTGYIQEMIVHGWDLATATGRPAELDPELAEFCLAFAHRALPPGAQRRRGALRPGSPRPSQRRPLHPASHLPRPHPLTLRRSKIISWMDAYLLPTRGVLRNFRGSEWWACLVPASAGLGRRWRGFELPALAAARPQ